MSGLPSLSGATRRIDFGSSAITNASDYQTFGPLYINVGSTLTVSTQYTSSSTAAAFRLLIMSASQFAMFSANPYHTLGQCSCTSYAKSQDMFPTLTPYYFTPSLAGLYHFVIAFNDDRTLNRRNFISGNIAFSMDALQFSITPGATISSCTIGPSSTCNVPTSGWLYAVLQQNASGTTTASLGSSSAIRYQFGQDSGKWGGMIVGILLGMLALGVIIGLVLFLVYLLLSILLPHLSVLNIIKRSLICTCMCFCFCCKRRVRSSKIYRRLAQEEEEQDKRESTNKYKDERTVLKVTKYLSEEERKRVDEAMNNTFEKNESNQELKESLQRTIYRYYFDGHIYDLRKRSRQYSHRQDRELIRDETKSALEWLQDNKDATQEQITTRRKQLDEKIHNVRTTNRTCSEILQIRAIAGREGTSPNYSTSWNDAIRGFWWNVHIFRYVLVEYADLSTKDAETIEEETLDAIDYLRLIEYEYHYKQQAERIEDIDKTRIKMCERLEPIVRRVVRERTNYNDISKERLESVNYRIKECLLSNQCHDEYYKFVTRKEHKELESLMKKGDRKQLEQVSDVIISDAVSRQKLVYYIRSLLKYESTNETYLDALEWYETSGRTADSHDCDEKLKQVQQAYTVDNVTPTKKNTQSNEQYETWKQKANSNIAVYRSEHSGCFYVILFGTLKNIGTLDINLLCSFNDRYNAKDLSTKVGDKINVDSVVAFDNAQITRNEATQIWTDQKLVAQRGSWVKLARKDNKYIASGVEDIVIAQKQPTEHETVFVYPIANDDKLEDNFEGERNYDQISVGLLRHLVEVFTQEGDLIVDWSATVNAGQGLLASLMAKRSCICVVDSVQEVFNKVKSKFEEALKNEEEITTENSKMFMYQDPGCNCICECD